MDLAYNMPHYFFIRQCTVYIVKRSDMFFWNNQRMYRSLRIQITETKYQLILIYNIGWDLFICYFTENAVHEKILPYQ